MLQFACSIPFIAYKLITPKAFNIAETKINTNNGGAMYLIMILYIP